MVDFVVDGDIYFFHRIVILHLSSTRPTYKQ